MYFHAFFIYKSPMRVWTCLWYFRGTWINILKILSVITDKSKRKCTCLQTMGMNTLKQHVHLPLDLVTTFTMTLFIFQWHWLCSFDIYFLNLKCTFLVSKSRQSTFLLFLVFRKITTRLPQSVQVKALLGGPG